MLTYNIILWKITKTNFNNKSGIVYLLEVCLVSGLIEIIWILTSASAFNLF